MEKKAVQWEDVCMIVVSATDVKMIVPLSKQENHELSVPQLTSVLLPEYYTCDQISTTVSTDQIPHNQSREYQSKIRV